MAPRERECDLQLYARFRCRGGSSESAAEVARGGVLARPLGQAGQVVELVEPEQRSPQPG